MPRNTIVVTDVSYNALGSRVQMLTVNYDGTDSSKPTLNYNDNIKIIQRIFVHSPLSSTETEIGTAKIAYNVTRRVTQQTIPIYDLSGSTGTQVTMAILRLQLE